MSSEGRWGLASRHPWREVSPDAYVDYGARTRHGGKVFYFNFELAKEMGLIGRRHPHRLNGDLAKAILDTFSLVIINEYDLEHRRQYPAQDLRPHKYMATRYLQCQHPSKKGLTLSAALLPDLETAILKLREAVGSQED